MVLLGVNKCINKKSTKYSSDILINGKRVYLGTFNTAEEAHQAYLAAIPNNETKYSTQSAK